MRLSPHEEYGLRCLVTLARLGGEREDGLVTIEQVARAEGIGYEHTAKILRALRNGGFLASARGVNGGYRLARPPSAITVWEALVALDPPLMRGDFCETYSGRLESCVHAAGTCNLRALWSHVGRILEEGLRGMTLDDLLAGRVPRWEGA